MTKAAALQDGQEAAVTVSTLSVWRTFTSTMLTNDLVARYAILALMGRRDPPHAHTEHTTNALTGVVKDVFITYGRTLEDALDARISPMK